MKRNFRSRQVSLRRVEDIVRETMIQKADINLGKHGDCKDYRCLNEIVSVRAEIESGKLLYRGKMNIRILAVNTGASRSILNGWRIFFTQRNAQITGRRHVRYRRKRGEYLGYQISEVATWK